MFSDTHVIPHLYLSFQHSSHSVYHHFKDHIILPSLHLRTDWINLLLACFADVVNFIATCCCSLPDHAYCRKRRSEDMTYLHSFLPKLGITFVCIQAALSLFFVAWVLVFRGKQVVRGSQPIFLVLVCSGCLIVSTPCPSKWTTGTFEIPLQGSCKQINPILISVALTSHAWVL